MLVDTTAERVARNESLFREANERLEHRFEDLPGNIERFPFLCECFEAGCMKTTLLSLVEYEVVRGRGNWFLVTVGHEHCVVDGEQVAAIAQHYDGYTIMAKVGRAGEVAEQLDPRADE